MQVRRGQVARVGFHGRPLWMSYAKASAEYIGCAVFGLAFAGIVYIAIARTWV